MLPKPPMSAAVMRAVNAFVFMCLFCFGVVVCYDYIMFVGLLDIK